MRASFIVLLLMTGPLFADQKKVISCELVPIQRFKDGSIYHLHVTNISGTKVTLCAVARHALRGDTAPAFYAAVTNQDGTQAILGEDDIRKAIENPDGNEDSFCTIAPGQSVWCGYPTIHTKLKKAVFHFLLRENGNSIPIHYDWRDDQSPLLTWKHVVGYRIPDGDAARIRLYEAPYARFGIHEPKLPRLEHSRKIFDMKPWCAQNGLAENEVDFAFYDYGTGFSLISTTEANHLRLRELRFHQR